MSYVHGLVVGVVLSGLVVGSAQAAPITTTYSGTIDWVSMQPGTSDTYGLGIDTIALGDTFSTSFVWDNDPAAVSYTFADDPYEMSYNFLGAPYSGSLGLNGNSTGGSHTESYVAKGTPVPSGDPSTWAPAWLTDLGLIPSGPLPTHADNVWLGTYSDDYDSGFDGSRNHPTGLTFAVELFDWGGDNGMISDLSLLSSMPDLNTSDFALFSIEQWDKGELLFEARGVLANNISNVSVPEPATLALIGLGLAGLGFSRKRTA